MKIPNIASVISYCSLDRAFLPHIVANVKKFSKQIIIVLSDHRFCGAPEDHTEILSQYPDCTFIQYAFTPHRLYGTDVQYAPDDLRLKHHWHNTPRLVGSYFLDNDVEWVAYFDGDEIIDGDAACAWIASGDLETSDAHRLAAYRYFRHPDMRAKTISDTVLFMKQVHAMSDVLLHLKERSGMAEQLRGMRCVKNSEGLPMVHHYSWVRSEENMLEKIKCWGHGNESNFREKIIEEMSRPFTGMDFIHGLEYEKAPIFVDPLKPLELPFFEKQQPICVDPMTIYNLEVKRQYVL